MLTNITDNVSQFQIIDETFKHSGIPMFWCDSSSFIIANTSFLTLTGFTEEELFKRHFNDLSQEQSSQLLLEEIFPSLKRDFKIITWVLETAAGKSISLELRITQFLIGEKIYYYGVVRNLSAKLPQVPVFTEESERLKIALRASKQGLWDWNAIADETLYDDEYYELLGYTPTDFEPNYTVWVEMLHPEDIDKAVIIWEDFVKNNKEEYSDEFRLKKKDGSYIWVTTKGKVINRDKEDKPIRIIGVVQDINTRKENEIKIQAQTQKLVDYAFFNSHRLRAPLSSIMGLAELLKHEYSQEIVENLDNVSHQLDDVIHEINKILVGDSFDYKQLQNTSIKKISLVDNDKLLHVVYKKTIERYTENIEITAYDRAKQILELLSNKMLNTDLILLDVDSDFDVWDFLTEFSKLKTETPIYLLAKNIALVDTIKATKFNSVKGILLKPLNKQALMNLIQQSNN